MSERPNGAELLSIARDTLAKELAPELAEDRRYLALMIANAMAIAARELELGEGVDRAELTSLRRMFQDPEPDVSEAVSDRLDALNRRLCAEIRRGGFSSGVDEARLRDHLRRSAEARVAISNPKALGQGRSAP